MHTLPRFHRDERVEEILEVEHNYIVCAKSILKKVRRDWKEIFANVKGFAYFDTALLLSVFPKGSLASLGGSRAGCLRPRRARMNTWVTAASPSGSRALVCFESYPDYSQA
jgi:hypothetical protein